MAQPDVGGGQRRRVVDPVADHHHPSTVVPQARSAASFSGRGERARASSMPRAAATVRHGRLAVAAQDGRPRGPCADRRATAEPASGRSGVATAIDPDRARRPARRPPPSRPSVAFVDRRRASEHGSVARRPADPPARPGRPPCRPRPPRGATATSAAGARSARARGGDDGRGDRDVRSPPPRAAASASTSPSVDAGDRGDRGHLGMPLGEGARLVEGDTGPPRPAAPARPRCG